VTFRSCRHPGCQLAGVKFCQMLRPQGSSSAELCCLGHLDASVPLVGGGPRDPARMPEGRRLRGVEIASGHACKAIGRRLIHGGGQRYRSIVRERPPSLRCSTLRPRSMWRSSASAIAG
jgi:hypothetical protein